MRRQTAVFSFVRVFIILVACFAATGGTVLLAATAESQFSAVGVGEAVTVEGNLELAGENYFLDPRFVVVDDEGNRIPVTSWAPLEVPPDPPSNPHAGSQIPTMRDYLHQRLSVTGVRRVVVGQPGQPGLPAALGDSYLEVQSVADPKTGVPVFDGPRATSAPGAGRAAYSEAAGNPEPTEAPLPATSTPHRVTPAPNATAGTLPAQGPLPAGPPPPASIVPHSSGASRPAAPATSQRRIGGSRSATGKN
jgi:hypothetical protein